VWDKYGILCLVERKDILMINSHVIHRSPDVLGGTPVFEGTRVPVQILIDYLEEGRPLEEFLDDFPTVVRTQAQEALEDLKKVLLE
jgi:uncharacterized protein (DUF433 family)